MLSGKLWSVHPHPYPDELLSSWLVRIAHANGEKVQSFCNHEFGSKHQVWNRDIDRLAPDWLLTALSERTATPMERVRQTTLKRYEGVLFDHSKSSGVEAWITPLKMYHRKHKGFGLQFCPLCLKEDKEPYFRTEWRVAFHSFCPKHQVMMHDRCSKCCAAVTFHRIDMNCIDVTDKHISACSNCGFDLSNSPVKEVGYIDEGIAGDWNDALSALVSGDANKFDIERMAVLHQFGKLLTFHSVSEELMVFIESKTDHILIRPDCSLST